RWLPALPVSGSRALAEFADALPDAGVSDKLVTRSPEDGQTPVQLFLGCLDQHWNRDTLQNAITVLEACNFSVRIPSHQVCCGAISQHEGRPREAELRTVQNRTAFDPSQPIISVSTGCSSQLHEHLGGTAADLLSFLHGHIARLPLTTMNTRVAVHVPCSQRNVLSAERLTEQLLQHIPGVETIRLDDNLGCCGAAGTHFLREADTARRLREDLLEQIAHQRPDRIVSANLGCALHLRAGLRERQLDIPIEHPITLLARCVRQR
ncbi:MAG: (Fe-S)-binding protein, partial [Gammaproteobacteria bacterium]|nr:(Fe-S)-binding protein [Gammaproteobacteria bacterium]